MPTRREILRREVGEKVRLENLLKPGLRRIFRRMVEDFRITVARTGFPQPASKYQPQFQTLLEEHYRKVQKAFSGAILLHNNADQFVELRRKQVDEEEEDIDELILAMFLLWREQYAASQADIISKTNQRDMQDAVNEAREELNRQGEPTDSRSVAAAASVILARKLGARVDLIVITETQIAAEAAKAVEASATTGVIIPGIPMPAQRVPLEPAVSPALVRELRKGWLDLRDDRVRETHLIAGRTYQAEPIPVNDPFIVGGARMMFPGDTSQGAPIREIANCRCSATYTVGASR